MGDDVESTAEQLANLEAKIDNEGGWEDAFFGYGIPEDWLPQDEDVLIAFSNMRHAWRERYVPMRERFQAALAKLSEEVGYTDRLGYW